ncbi:MAG: hypothetical protein EOP04_02280 [Proteobacteria bacterium]|nr:MAG: hypothetical protein EOP04_02280 [Pseudomonadota bacterium]
MESPQETEAITKAFGRVISAYRSKNRLSRPQLAEGIGLSVPAIQKLEGGEGGGFHIGSFIKFAAIQKKPLTELMAELEVEAALSGGNAKADRVIQHVVNAHLSVENQEILRKGAARVVDHTNDLAWALNVAAELLSLESSDRDDFELSILRKSPHRNEPRLRARLTALVHKTIYGEESGKKDEERS